MKFLRFCVLRKRPPQNFIRKTLSVLETFIAYSANKRAQKRPHHLTRVAFSCVALHSGTFEPNFFQISKSYTEFGTIHPALRMAGVSKFGKFESVWLFCYSTRFEQSWKKCKNLPQNRLFFYSFFQLCWNLVEFVKENTIFNFFMQVSQF